MYKETDEDSNRIRNKNAEICTETELLDWLLQYGITGWCSASQIRLKSFVTIQILEKKKKTRNGNTAYKIIYK